MFNLIIKEKMKRKPAYKQIITSALASTILLESCVKDCNLYYLDKSVQDINKEYQANYKNSTPFSLLNIQINNEDRQYFDFINKLTNDILQDRSKAAIFLANPSDYAVSSGFPNLIISLDDDLIKLITAIADEEIYNAIQQNNISRFIQLCKENNIVTNFQIADVERVNRLIEENPALLSLMNINNPDSSVVVASVAGTWFWTTWGADSTTPLINNDPLLLQIWALNGGQPSNTFLMLSEYEETQMSEFISILENEFPDKLVNVNKESLKQVIALNLKQISD